MELEITRNVEDSQCNSTLQQCLGGSFVLRDTTDVTYHGRWSRASHSKPLTWLKHNFACIRYSTFTIMSVMYVLSLFVSKKINNTTQYVRLV